MYVSFENVLYNVIICFKRLAVAALSEKTAWWCLKWGCSWCSTPDGPAAGAVRQDPSRAAAEAGGAATGSEGRDSRALLFGRTQEPVAKAPSFLEKMRPFKR